MEFRQYANNEAAALVERLVAAADATAQQLRLDANEEIEKLRRDAEALRADLETESARAASLSADLDAAIQAHRVAEGDRLNAESARQKTEEELRGVRELLEDARGETSRVSDALRAEASEKARLDKTYEDTVRELQSRIQAAHDNEATLEARLAGAEARIQEITTQAALESQKRLESLTREAEALRAQDANARAHAGAEIRRADEQLQAVRLSQQAQAEKLLHLEARLHDADATVASLQAQVHDAHAITDATHRQLSLVQERMRSLTAMFKTSVSALDALGAATTVSGVFDTLVNQLAAEFQRAAIFRIKGHHLQGELAVGLDDAVDITKLVIPLGMDSVIAKAAASGTLEHATARQISGSRPPFGNAPASAIAAPLVFQDETLAVVYADSDAPSSEAHVAFAGVLVRHANAMLARLAQELKAEQELRRYAQMLLSEAEQMFLADLEAARTDHDRVRRLRDTIECARQLYAQRAALESVAAPHLLDEQIASIVESTPVTPFARDLASTAARQEARRTAS